MKIRRILKLRLPKWMGFSVISEFFVSGKKVREVEKNNHPISLMFQQK